MRTGLSLSIPWDCSWKEPMKNLLLSLLQWIANKVYFTKGLLCRSIGNSCSRALLYEPSFRATARTIDGQWTPFELYLIASVKSATRDPGFIIADFIPKA